MKLFLKPSVKASERFFVSRAAVEEQASVMGVLEAALVRGMAAAGAPGSGDDVVVSAGGALPDGHVAEFLLGVSVSGGAERVLSVRRASGGDAWNAAVALEVQRELRRENDVFVLHGVVERVSGVEVVTVWSAEVHVLPVKFAARMQALAELAWARVCEKEGVTCGLPVVVPEVAARSEVVVDITPLSAEEELMLMMPEGWDETESPAF